MEHKASQQQQQQNTQTLNRVCSRNSRISILREKKKKVGKTEEHETANFCELPYCQHAGIRHIGSSEQWDLFLP